MAGATAKETAIIGNIEKKLGPVGKGHHNSHRTAALLRWVKKHEADGSIGKKNPTDKKKGN